MSICYELFPTMNKFSSDLPWECRKSTGIVLLNLVSASKPIFSTGLLMQHLPICVVARSSKEQIPHNLEEHIQTVVSGVQNDQIIYVI